MDSPLTDKGVRQAEALRDRLSEIKIDRIYVSPLPRTVRTASIINEKQGLKLIEEPMLMERNFGEWDGIYVPKLAESFGVTVEWMFEHPLEFNPVSGEHHNDFSKRMVAVVDRLASENEDKTILLVTHGDAMRMLLTYFHGYDLMKTEIKDSVMQASLTKVIYKDGTYTILFENNLDHLKNLSDKE